LLRRWGLDVRRDLTLVDLGVNDKSFEALKKDRWMPLCCLPKSVLAAAQRV
jgi:hypothetical protein